MTKNELKEVIISKLKEGNTLTKKTLVATTLTNERTIREAIAEINRDEYLYPDVLIVATSDRAGYKLVDPYDDKEEIEHFVNEREKRARETLAPLKKAHRLLLAERKEHSWRIDHNGEMKLF